MIDEDRAPAPLLRSADPEAFDRALGLVPPVAVAVAVPPPSPNPGSQPIPFANAPDALGLSALAELQSALRRRGLLEPKQPVPPSWVRVLGVGADGTAFVMVEHPRLAERPDAQAVVVSDHERWMLVSSAVTLPGLARARWLACDPHWHGLEQGLGLLLDDKGPRADLERRRRIAADEETAELAAAGEAERLRFEAQAKESERRQLREAWQLLPVETRRCLVVAQRYPDLAGAFELLGQMLVDRCNYPPEGWRPR